MFVRIYLLALLLCLSCNLTANAQISPQLSQVTSESQIVSGRTYLLYFVDKELDLTVSDDNNKYSFGRRKLENSNTWVAGFYQTGEKIVIKANRAYLETPVTSSTSQSRGFDLPSEGDITGVSEILPEAPASTVETPWYTLDGRCLNGTPNKRGIYVKNGKKIVVR